MSGVTASWPVHEGVLKLGDLPAERGGVIRDARLSWQSHGTLNAAGDNVIVYPCSYTTNHDGLSWLIGPDGVLDPTRWFIVIPDMFSNGLSSGAADTEDYRSWALSNSEHCPAGGPERSWVTWSGGMAREAVTVFRHGRGCRWAWRDPPSLSRVRHGALRG
jgi:hypothetical protein